MTAGNSKDERGPDDNSSGADAIVPFPYSRVTPSRTSAELPVEPLPGQLAKQIGVPAEQTTGHWCSRCRRIWFGYLLEVTCPACGNRHG